MGMYDTVTCDYPLPDPQHQDLAFQTKDLERGMGHYTITRDGRGCDRPGAAINRSAAHAGPADALDGASGKDDPHHHLGLPPAHRI